MLTDKMKRTLRSESEVARVKAATEQLCSAFTDIEKLGISQQTLSFGRVMLDKIADEMREARAFVLDVVAFEQIMKNGMK